MGCGCGSGEINWEIIRRLLEETDNDPDEAPIEVTEDDVFNPARKIEEVEVDSE